MNDEPGTAVARREMQSLARPAIMSDDEIRRSWRIAEALSAAGVFPGDREGAPASAALAFAKMLIGRDLGLEPTQALMGIHIVKGKPMVSATTLAGFVKRTPGYDFKVKTLDNEQAVIDFLVDGKRIGTSAFTMEDAENAGLVKSDSGWKKYPRNMLFARALSNGIRWYMPDATGGVPVYSEGEIESRPTLTQGRGGDAESLDLGPKVEKVLARAAEAGHAGLADRAAAEMALGGSSPEKVVEWCRQAEAELDDFEAPEAEVVEPVAGDPDPAEEAAARRETAAQLDRDAEAADAEGKADEAESLRAGAAELREQADALAGQS